MWQIIGIVLAFTVILVLVNKKVSLGYALIIGSLLVAPFSGLTIGAVIRTFGVSIIDPLTIRLVAVLGLIGVMGNVMQRMGVLAKLVQALNKVLRNPKLTIAAIPSIMGTLLVTGGAIMSAPLVDEIGTDLNLSKNHKAAINLIFRHAWYFIFPFMPAFILLAETANINKFEIISLQWPLALVMIVTAYLTLIHPAKPSDHVAKPPKPHAADIKALVTFSAPLWVSIALAYVIERWAAPGFINQASFPLALCVGIGLATILGDKSEISARKAIIQGIKPTIIMSGVGIMIFKGMVGQLTVIGEMVESMMGAGVPLAVLFVTLPWLAGFLSANNTSAIGITLPILMPALALVANPIALLMLLYASSFIGYLVSPLHLCQVLTVEYFSVKIHSLYRRYLIPMPATLVTGIILYYIAR